MAPCRVSVDNRLSHLKDGLAIAPYSALPHEFPMPFIPPETLGLSPFVFHGIQPDKRVSYNPDYVLISGVNDRFKITDVDPESPYFKGMIHGYEKEASIEDFLKALNYTWTLSDGRTIDQVQAHTTCPIIHRTLLKDFETLLFQSENSAREVAWKSGAPEGVKLFYNWTEDIQEQRILQFLHLNLPPTVKRPYSYLIADVIAYVRCVKDSGASYLTHMGTSGIGHMFRENRRQFWIDQLKKNRSMEESSNYEDDAKLLITEASRIGEIAERNLKEGMGLKLDQDLTVPFLNYINYIDPSYNSIAGPLFDATQRQSEKHRLRGPIDNLNASYILSGPFHLAPTESATDHLSFAKVNGRIAVLVAGERVIGGTFLAQRIGVTGSAGIPSLFLELVHSHILLFCQDAESERIGEKMFGNKWMDMLRDFHKNVSPARYSLQLEHFPIFAPRLQHLEQKMNSWRPRGLREILIRGYKDPLTFYAFWFAVIIGVVNVLTLGVSIAQAYYQARP